MSDSALSYREANEASRLVKLVLVEHSYHFFAIGSNSVLVRVELKTEAKVQIQVRAQNLFLISPRLDDHCTRFAIADDENLIRVQGRHQWRCKKAGRRLQELPCAACFAYFLVSVDKSFDRV